MFLAIRAARLASGRRRAIAARGFAHRITLIVGRELLLSPLPVLRERVKVRVRRKRECLVRPAPAAPNPHPCPLPEYRERENHVRRFAGFTHIVFLISRRPD